jgi:hypothetical protein
VEDSRHSVSDRVLKHYKSLKNGEAAIEVEEDTSRKPLEGDWYIFQLGFANEVLFASKTYLNHQWRIRYIVKLCAATISTKSVLINGREASGKKGLTSLVVRAFY